MAKPELMNLYWSAPGIMAGQAEISPYDFESRVKSAAKAGFIGIGLWHTDLEHILISRSLKDMKAILDDNGIKYVEVEFLMDWFVEGARRTESDVRRKKLFDASAAIGAKHVKVGDFYNTPCSMPKLIDSFGALCRDAERYGATIGFEFMASAMLNTLEGALAMVEGAAPKNGGLIVDIVHIMTIGISYAAVSRIPRNYLINVELNDGTLPGSPKADPSRARRFCGEGEFDIKGFIAAVQKTGYAGPWAVEVFSQELVAWPQDKLNEVAYRTTMAQFE